MVKVKIFRLNDALLLEEQVNDFLKTKKIIDIRYTTHSIYDRYTQNGVPIHSTLYDSVLVIYEED